MPESTSSEPTAQPAACTAASGADMRAAPVVSRATPAARQAATAPASRTATTPDARRATPPTSASTAARTTPTPRRTRTNGPRVGTGSLLQAQPDNGDPRSPRPSAARTPARRKRHYPGRVAGNRTPCTYRRLTATLQHRARTAADGRCRTPATTAAQREDFSSDRARTSRRRGERPADARDRGRPDPAPHRRRPAAAADDPPAGRLAAAAAAAARADPAAADPAAAVRAAAVPAPAVPARRG